MYKLPFILLSLLLSLSFQETAAQDFAVTTKGDTLRGKIKLLQHDVEKRIQVLSEQKQKTTLSIMKVRTVWVNNERFDPIRYNNQYVFMKLLKEGYLSLYGFQLEKQFSYDGRYLVKKDGKGMEVPNLVFKKNMSTFLQECEAVKSSIESGKMGRNQLDQIIDEFNACIDKNSTLSYTPPSVAVDPATTASWSDLQTKVEGSTIDAKADALEMISEVQAKLKRGEKLPKFLIEGLRESFEGNTELTQALNKALATTH